MVKECVKGEGFSLHKRIRFDDYTFSFPPGFLIFSISLHSSGETISRPSNPTICLAARNVSRLLLILSSRWGHCQTESSIPTRDMKAEEECEGSEVGGGSARSTDNDLGIFVDFLDPVVIVHQDFHHCLGILHGRSAGKGGKYDPVVGFFQYARLDEIPMGIVDVRRRCTRQSEACIPVPGRFSFFQWPHGAVCRRGYPRKMPPPC